jgi:hypothetical protein
MLIRIMAGLVTLLGGGTLAWYSSLSEEEKQKADGLASEYASRFYNIAVDQLSDTQADDVNGQVQRHFVI